MGKTTEKTGLGRKVTKVVLYMFTSQFVLTNNLTPDFWATQMLSSETQPKSRSSDSRSCAFFPNEVLQDLMNDISFSQNKITQRHAPLVGDPKPAFTNKSYQMKNY